MPVASHLLQRHTEIVSDQLEVTVTYSRGRLRDRCRSNVLLSPRSFPAQQSGMDLVLPIDVSEQCSVRQKSKEFGMSVVCGRECGRCCQPLTDTVLGCLEG
jgi:hypothetical protein